MYVNLLVDNKDICEMHGVESFKDISFACSSMILTIPWKDMEFLRQPVFGRKLDSGI
jgi:hypothetical protein